jgi:hypothetical protein
MAASQDGSSTYLVAQDSADWDVFGSTSNDCTVCGWVYCDDAAGSAEAIIDHYEDGNNFWDMYRTAGGALSARYVSGSTYYVNITGGTLSQSTWHHVCLAKIGAETGIYIDGSQVAYDATFTPDTFAGSLYFGQIASANYFDGQMQDWCICYQNIFGAAPVVGVTDTIDVDTLNPLKLVM